VRLALRDELAEDGVAEVSDRRDQPIAIRVDLSHVAPVAIAMVKALHQRGDSM
jgi:hypothetical protein